MAVAAIGLGVASGVMGFMSSKAQAAQAAASTAFQNTVADEKAKLNLEMQKKSFKRRSENVEKQYKINADEMSRQYEQTQAVFNEQMAQFAYKSQGMINQLAQVEGSIRARGGAVGRSSERVAAVRALGEYGRQSRKMLDNMQSADRQLERNMQDIKATWAKADRAAWQTLLTNQPLPTFVAKTPIPKFNSGLAIGNALISGMSTAHSMTSAGLFNSESYKNTVIGDFFGIPRGA